MINQIRTDGPLEKKRKFVTRKLGKNILKRKENKIMIANAMKIHESKKKILFAFNSMRIVTIIKKNPIIVEAMIKSKLEGR